MRAKQVNEANFERGQDPKTAMDIGGIDLMTDYNDRLEEIKSDIEDIKVQRSEEWQEYIRKILPGKKITADMSKLPTINKSGKTQGKYERGTFTIEVQDAMPSEPLGDLVTRSEGLMPIPNLVVADTENNMYQLNLNQKIRIS